MERIPGIPASGGGAMTDDTITRARAAVARLRGADSYTDAYRKPPAERVTVGEQALGEMLDAVPALLVLAEAAGRLAEGKVKSAPWWRVFWWNDSGYDICAGCLEPTYKRHDPDCPALAIDAALADLAALAGDADAGEVTP